MSGRVSEVRERVSAVRGLKERMHESDEFRTREFNAILRSCEVSRTAQSFLASVGRRGLVLLSAKKLGLWRSEVDFGKSLATVQSATKSTVCYRDGAVIPEVLACRLSRVSRKGQSGHLRLEEEPCSG